MFISLNKSSPYVRYKLRRGLNYTNLFKRKISFSPNIKQTHRKFKFPDKIMKHSQIATNTNTTTNINTNTNTNMNDKVNDRDINSYISHLRRSTLDVDSNSRNCPPILPRYTVASQPKSNDIFVTGPNLNFRKNSRNPKNSEINKSSSNISRRSMATMRTAEGTLPHRKIPFSEKFNTGPKSSRTQKMTMLENEDPRPNAVVVNDSKVNEFYDGRSNVVGWVSQPDFSDFSQNDTQYDFLPSSDRIKKHQENMKLIEEYRLDPKEARKRGIRLSSFSTRRAGNRVRGTLNAQTDQGVLQGGVRGRTVHNYRNRGGRRFFSTGKGQREDSDIEEEVLNDREGGNETIDKLSEEIRSLDVDRSYLVNSEVYNGRIIVVGKCRHNNFKSNCELCMHQTARRPITFPKPKLSSFSLLNVMNFSTTTKNTPKPLLSGVFNPVRNFSRKSKEFYGIDTRENFFHSDKMVERDQIDPINPCHRPYTWGYDPNSREWKDWTYVCGGLDTGVGSGMGAAFGPNFGLDDLEEKRGLPYTISWRETLRGIPPSPPLRDGIVVGPGGGLGKTDDRHLASDLQPKLMRRILNLQPGSKVLSKIRKELKYDSLGYKPTEKYKKSEITQIPSVSRIPDAGSRYVRFKRIGDRKPLPSSVNSYQRIISQINQPQRGRIGWNKGNRVGNVRGQITRRFSTNSRTGTNSRNRSINGVFGERNRSNVVNNKTDINRNVGSESRSDMYSRVQHVHIQNEPVNPPTFNIHEIKKTANDEILSDIYSSECQQSKDSTAFYIKAPSGKKIKLNSASSLQSPNVENHPLGKVSGGNGPSIYARGRGTN